MTVPRRCGSPICKVPASRHTRRRPDLSCSCTVPPFDPCSLPRPADIPFWLCTARCATGVPPNALSPANHREGLRDVHAGPRRIGYSGLTEDPVQVGATDRALALGHPSPVGLDDLAFGLALFLALHAVELAAVCIGHACSC